MPGHRQRRGHERLRGDGRGAWAGCLAPVAGATWNRVHGGPGALLAWLEAQLGLAGGPVPWTGRVPAQERSRTLRRNPGGYEGQVFGMRSSSRKPPTVHRTGRAPGRVGAEPAECAARLGRALCPRQRSGGADAPGRESGDDGMTGSPSTD